jgi:hypothetical protein
MSSSIPSRTGKSYTGFLPRTSRTPLFSNSPAHFGSMKIDLSKQIREIRNQLFQLLFSPPFNQRRLKSEKREDGGGREEGGRDARAISQPLPLEVLHRGGNDGFASLELGEVGTDDDVLVCPGGSAVVYGDVGGDADICGEV